MINTRDHGDDTEILNYVNWWDSAQYFLKWPRHEHKYVEEIKQIIREELIEDSDIVFGIDKVFFNYDIHEGRPGWKEDIPEPEYRINVKYKGVVDGSDVMELVKEFGDNLGMYGYSLDDIVPYESNVSDSGVTLVIYKNRI